MRRIVALMGTTVSNLHISIGDEALSAESVAELVSETAMIAPDDGGWLSVFPAEDNPGDDALAARLSATLGRPVVNFFCFDSDIAVGTLIVDGRVLDRIVVGWPGAFEELMGDGTEAGADVSDGDRDDEIASGFPPHMEVTGDLDTWIATLGSRTTKDHVVEAIKANKASPFAEDVAAAVFGVLGVSPRKLLMSHRFYLQGEDPETAATFVRT